MREDVLAALTEFHREVWLPEMKQLVEEANTSNRRETLAHMDDNYVRFGRLEDEYQMLKAAVIRIEQQLTAIEQHLAAIDTKLDQSSLKAELDELKEQVAGINSRIAHIEQQLSRS